MPGCQHLDTVKFVDAPEDVAGCEECLKTGWCHPDELMFRLRGG